MKEFANMLLIVVGGGIFLGSIFCLTGFGLALLCAKLWQLAL